jgi:hypothetical protein
MPDRNPTRGTQHFFPIVASYLLDEQRSCDEWGRPTGVPSSILGGNIIVLSFGCLPDDGELIPQAVRVRTPDTYFLGDEREDAMGGRGRAAPRFVC